MNTASMVSVTEIANSVQATQEDIASLSSFAQDVIHTDPATGKLYVDKRKRPLLEGALCGAIYRRKDARALAADEALTEAHEALLAGPRLPRTAADRLVWESDMLTLLTRLTGALTELVDAKVDQGTMRPRTADRLRGDAAALQRSAEVSVTAAVNKARRSLGF